MLLQYKDWEEIDRYLLGKLSEGEDEAFRARLLIDDHLTEQVKLQSRTHEIIRSASRQFRKAELDHMYQRLMRKPGFYQKVKNIFGYVDPNRCG